MIFFSSTLFLFLSLIFLNKEKVFCTVSAMFSLRKCMYIMSHTDKMYTWICSGVSYYAMIKWIFRNKNNIYYTSNFFLISSLDFVLLYWTRKHGNITLTLAILSLLLSHIFLYRFYRIGYITTIYMWFAWQTYFTFTHRTVEPTESINFHWKFDMLCCCCWCWCCWRFLSD